eukprot:9413978-Ditylum_brightwellii.AAC.1
MGPATAPLAAPLFAVTPAQYAATTIIDYGTTTGWKHWYKATPPLPASDMFACKLDQINVLCENLNKHASNCAWNHMGADIVNIPDDNN